MKLTIPHFTKNPTAFMRSCGYAFEKEIRDEQAFVRRIAGYDYPKFHAYIHIEKTPMTNDQCPMLIINLHIDQKKPSYGNHTAHSGDYDGALISQELERIKNKHHHLI